MENRRRLFINQVSLLAGIAALNKPLSSIASVSKRLNTIHSQKSAVTIYHTNNLNGKTEAVYGNLGGLRNVKTELSKQRDNGIILDAGGFLNSTHSFTAQKNVIDIMNSMGYHVSTPGYNEFANGQTYLAKLIPHMQFSLVNCNYTFDQNLSSLIKPYIILNSGKFRVGVTGVGSKLKGITYNNAILSANKTAAFLKSDGKCDLVICLSQLRHEQNNDMPNDRKLASQSEHIDMIIGCHASKIMSGPMILHNKHGHEIIISQTAPNGLMMGKTIFNMDDGKEKQSLDTGHLFPGRFPQQDFAATCSLLRLKQKVA